MSFQCTVVTPEQQAFDGSIKQAIVPAHDGLIGLLTDRAPLLTKLGTGPLRLDIADHNSQFFFIDGGVAQMKDNKLTILTTQAIPASEIDYQAAHAEYAAAAASRATDPAGLEKRQHQMAAAKAKEALAIAKK